MAKQPLKNPGKNMGSKPTQRVQKLSKQKDTSVMVKPGKSPQAKNYPAVTVKPRPEAAQPKISKRSDSMNLGYGDEKSLGGQALLNAKMKKAPSLQGKKNGAGK